MYWFPTAAASTLVCEEPLYRLEEGESVTVCLRFIGPVALDADVLGDLFVEASIYTIADGKFQN